MKNCGKIMIMFLLLFNAVYSSHHNKSRHSNCSDIKCEATEALCFRIKSRDEKQYTSHVLMNMCGMRFLKCNQGLAAVRVPTEYCNIRRKIQRVQNADTTRAAGGAAETAAKLKHAKYSNLEPVYEFVPVAVETGGPWCAEARNFIAALARQLRGRGADPRSGTVTKTRSKRQRVEIKKYARTRTRKNAEKKERLKDKIMIGFAFDVVANSTKFDVIKEAMTQIQVIAKDYHVGYTLCHAYNSDKYELTDGTLMPEEKDYKYIPITENITNFKNYLKDIRRVEPKDGGPCGKPVMTMTLMTLNVMKREIKDNTTKMYLYVFADAPAFDAEKSKRVVGTHRKTNIQVSFIMTPGCYDRWVRKLPEFQVFFDTAVNCNGQFLRMNTEKLILQVPNYVKHTALAYEPDVIISRIKRGTVYPVQFYVPKNNPYVVLSISGSGMDLIVTNEAKNRVMPEFIVNAANTKVYRLVAPPPGLYSVRVDVSVYHFGSLNSSINVIFTGVHFTFDFGFSGQPKASLEDTTKKIPKNETYVIIEVNEPRNLVDVKWITIVDKDGDKQTHKLIWAGEDVYYTENPVLLTDGKTKLIVSGILKGTQMEITATLCIYKPTKPTTTTTERTRETRTTTETVTTTTTMTTTTTSEPTTTTTTSEPTTTTTTSEPTTTTAPNNTRITDDFDEIVTLPSDANLATTETRNPKFNTKGLQKLKAGFDSWKHQLSSCPSQCPARDVMVCARCQHGVHRTFLSDCHMRVYQCRHPRDMLELVARRSCVAISPYLDPPRLDPPPLGPAVRRFLDCRAGDRMRGC